MALTFTAQQRKDITRRQLNIATENAAYANTSASLSDQATKLLSVDGANATFYNYQRAIASAYELEGQALNGTQAAEYTDGSISPFVAGDLSTSAQTPGATGATFFPSSPTPYAYFIPLITDAINGFNHPTGVTTGESNTISNSTVFNGLSQLIAQLGASISGSGSTTTTTAIPAGVQSGLVLSVTVTTGFSVNDLVYIKQGSASGIYKISAIVPSTSITVSSVVHTQLGIATGATITNSAAAFTTTERQTLVAVTYQEILTNETNQIAALITNWKTFLNTQVTQLAANQDTRSPQATQNTTASANATAAIAVLNTWLALPNTGVSGRYTSGSLSPISSEITTRSSAITSRITDIVTALGSVAQTGNSYSGVVGSPYYERYKWLDNRINRATGSARRYFDASSGQSFLGMLSANNTAVQGDYNAYFLTKAITFIDQTPIIHVTDVTGLSNGDTITILSETQPEIQRAIIQIMGTTQLQLDSSIPNTYTVADQARLFKSLQ